MLLRTLADETLYQRTVLLNTVRVLLTTQVLTLWDTKELKMSPGACLFR